jgi:cell division inhibitor SulA
MSDQQADEPAIVARLTSEALRLVNDRASFTQWIATLTDRERAALTDWAQRQDARVAQMLARVDDVVKRIDDNHML